MAKFTYRLACLLFLLAPTAANADLIAITEFMANPGTIDDTDGEFVELFNYGTTEVNLLNWTIEDADGDSTTIGNITIGSGEFIVLGRNKSVLESEYFGGVAQDDIHQVTGLVLANSTDELILKDDGGNTVFNIAYGNDDSSAQSTWLTTADITRTDWGTKGGDLIDRDGDDLSTAGLLGYEKQNATSEAAAITGANGNVASLLDGNYNISAVPEPSTFGLLGAVAGIAYFVRRRKSKVTSDPETK